MGLETRESLLLWEDADDLIRRLYAEGASRQAIGLAERVGRRSRLVDNAISNSRRELQAGVEDTEMEMRARTRKATLKRRERSTA